MGVGNVHGLQPCFGHVQWVGNQHSSQARTGPRQQVHTRLKPPTRLWRSARVGVELPIDGTLGGFVGGKPDGRGGCICG